MIKKVLPLLLCLLLWAGCDGQSKQGDTALPQSGQEQNTEGGSTMEPNTYNQISPEEAKAMMEEETDYILLDVRSQEEYAEGHIQGAIVIPDNEIADRAQAELTDKEAITLVYCRSGRRSKLAAQALADLGYTNVYEFGGILDWPYETVK